MKVILYKGISTSKSYKEIKNQILTNNQITRSKLNKSIYFDKEKYLKEVEENIKKDVDIRFTGYDLSNHVFGCGTLYGALHYAYREKTETKLVIEYETDVNNLEIDPRDGLYNIFQYINEDYFTKKEKHHSRLCDVYGEDITCVLEISLTHSSNNAKMNLADKFILQNNNIKEHLKNSSLIKGRMNTYFYSSFRVIDATKCKIISVRELNDEDYMFYSNVSKEDSFEIMRY